MAKKKKRARGGSAQDTASEETAATPRAAELGGAEPRDAEQAQPAATATAPDRFDPFASPRARLLANAFIAAFLAYQVAMPLRYYLGGRGLDERFSWRMFSSVRMLDCHVEVAERVGAQGDFQQRAVSLNKEVQVAWIGLLERGRSLVIDKLLSRRCDEQGVVQVDYHLSCRAPDGAKWPDVDRHMSCTDRKLAEGRAEP